jgi:hypothetical protein
MHSYGHVSKQPEKQHLDHNPPFPQTRVTIRPGLGRAVLVF